MIVNQQSLRGIYVGFNTLFNKAFEEVAPIYTEVATVTPSTTDSETYAWLGDIPGMREWIGDREIQNLTASDYTIKNKDFELTVGVDRNAIEDDKIGLYNPSVQMLGQSAAAHPDELIFALLAGGFSEKCYDGQPFFSDAHKVGKKTISNKTTAKLSMESYIAARASMMSLTNSKGRALNLVPNLLVVPQLAGHDSAWYLLCASRPIRPLIWQQRKKPKFVSKTAETDDNVFMRKTFLYGADYRGNAGFGFWQMAYGGDGTAE